MKEFKHGESGYNHHKCRCPECKLAKLARAKSPKGKIVKARADAKYIKTIHGRASHARSMAKYKRSLRGKTVNANWAKTPKGRANSARGCAKWEKKNPGHRLALNAKHRATKHHATPPWLTKTQHTQIEAFYIEAQRLTKETGIKHVVDHIWPLQGKDFVGLHVPWNLRVITSSENSKKRNHRPLEKDGEVLKYVGGKYELLEQIK